MKLNEDSWKYFAILTLKQTVRIYLYRAHLKGVCSHFNMHILHF